MKYRLSWAPTTSTTTESTPAGTVNVSDPIVV
jgi:hypothetical protein